MIISFHLPPIVAIAAENGKAIRIGVNWGSLDQDLLTELMDRNAQSGDVLARHSDRCSCEVSVTANLGCIASSPWPIWIEGPQGAVPVEMQPGKSGT